MSRTDRFREEHNTFIKQVTEISNYFSDVAKVSANASQIRSILSQLAGAVRLHLGTEDQSLYPALMKCEDTKVSAMAKTFQMEMGGIKQAFEDYSKKWATALLIQANPSDFIKESKAVFDVLRKRIDRENTELYQAAAKLNF